MGSSNTIEIIIKGKDETGGAFGGLQKTLGSLGGMFVSGGMFGAGIAAVQAGLSAAAGAVKGFAAATVTSNAEFERYTTQFGVLLGSAEAAKERLAELAEFGAKTPFELPEVVRADKILQGFGLHAVDAKDKFGFAGTEIRTIAGDVAAGSGASFEEMAGYIGKFASGATGEALMRFQELGIVTRTQLAEMGLEFSKSGQLMSPLPEATEVLLTAMKEKYGGMMDAQSQTFEGMMSNVQDWIGQTLRAMGQPIFEILRDKLADLLAFMNSPEAKGIIDNLTNAIATGIEKLVPVVESLGKAFSQLLSGDTAGALSTLFGPEKAAVIINIANALKSFAGAVTTIAGQLSAGNITGALESLFGADITGRITSVASVLQGIFVQAWNALSVVISEVVSIAGPAVQTFIAGVQNAFKSAGPAVDAFKSLWVSLGPLLSAAAKVIGGALVAAVGIVVGLFNGLAKAVEPALKAVIAAITMVVGVVEGLAKIFTGVFNVIIGIVTGDGNRVRAAFQTMGDGIKKIFDSLVSGIVAVFKNLWSAVVNLVSGFVQGVIKYFTDLYNRLVGHSIVWDIVNGIIGAFSGMVRSIQSVWAGIVSAVTSAANNIWSFINSWISRLEMVWNIGTNALRTVWSSLWAAIPGVVSGAASAVTGAVTTLKANVERVWSGLKTSLSTAWTQAWEAIKSTIGGVWSSLSGILTTLITNILNKFKNTDWLQIGAAIIDGLKKGVQNGVAGLLTFIVGVANNIIAKFREAVGARSPSTEFEKIGLDITAGLIQGINQDLDAQLGALQKTLREANANLAQALKDQNASAIKAAREQLNTARAEMGDFMADLRSGWLAGLAELDMAGALGQIAGSFASKYEAQIEPLRKEMEYWQEQVEAAKQAFSEDWGEPPSWQYLSELMQQLNAGMLDTTITSGDLFAAFQKLYEVYQPLINATSAYYAEQQKITELQNQQKDLAFLEMQVDLLKLVKENGLDASQILGGLELGLNADTGGILQAMTKAMEAMIAQAQTDLGIASPSTVFYDMATEINAGLAQGITDTVAGPLSVWQAFSQQMLSVWDGVWVTMVSRAQEAIGQIQALMSALSATFNTLGGLGGFSGAGGFGGTSITNGNTYNLSVTTSRTAEPVLSSINMMTAWSV